MFILNLLQKNHIKAYKKSKNFYSLRTMWDLIEDIKNNGVMNGIGLPERLRRDLDGCYSRRTNDINRLVYRIIGTNIEILSCKGHYSE